MSVHDLPTGKRVVQQWCSEAAAADIGADTIGQWAAQDDARDNGLTIIGDVTVKQLDARKDTHWEQVEGRDYPAGLPILIAATYRCLTASPWPAPQDSVGTGSTQR